MKLLIILLLLSPIASAETIEYTYQASEQDNDYLVYGLVIIGIIIGRIITWKS